MTAVAFSPDGSTVALGSMGEVRTYSAADPDKAILTLSGIQGPIYSIVYQPSAARLAVAGYDGAVRLFDAKTGNLVKQFVPVPIGPWK